MMSSSPDLATRLRETAVSTAERKVAAALAENFPSSAMGTVETLATRAGVSGPTVLRYLAKLGFRRFAAFQAAVLEEIERQLGSPLQQLDEEAGRGTEGGHIYRNTLLMQSEALRKAANQVVPAEFDSIVELLANPKLRIKALGGRYSRNLAERLVMQMSQVREDVVLLRQELGFAFDALADIGPRDLLIIFDYRRYQDELLQFAKGASDAGARIVLMTDPWRSPIAQHAQAVLTAPDDTSSPFGSRVVPTAQVEALVAAVVEHDREAARARLSRIEALRARPGTDETEVADD
ncbi:MULTISPECIES: MurR/RpiR family transcriptional regulator [Mameliella]|uniref:MurR/RpiR family transcriptional regulator n=1 Tax=Mameliella TaxID=1434019 RepID=UPI00184D5568|nr:MULTISPECIES: MurR/RpiR family transcriptional regulator [Mameliella]MCR9275461.1 MurR/RpiR family transcriptional regulator [Paracoccaceae bacterium]